MTGIDRLRTLAGAWDEWGLGGSLTEIADQIERELARHDEPDSTDNGARLPYVTDKEREALEWVRKYGGIGCVQTMAAKLGDTLTWIRERAGLSKYEAVDYNELLDALDRRLMPEGIEWPRYESGEPVGFGDDVSRNGEDFEVKAIALYRDGSFSLNFWAYSKGERVKRHAPAVLAADGEPLEVGQTVWDTDAESDTPLTVVEVSSDIVRCEYKWKDGKVYRPYCSPDTLTHAKPESIDTWQRIEEDAGCTATKYNERRGTIFTTKQQVARDLVRRCKALAEKENRNE